MSKKNLWGIIILALLSSCKSDPYEATGVAITKEGESLVIADPLIQDIEEGSLICLTNIGMKNHWKISNQCGETKMCKVFNEDSVVVGFLIKAKLTKKL